MNSYKIYLTKSSEVAGRIAKSFTKDGNWPSDIETISQGMVNENTDAVPAIYREQGYHHCTVTLKEAGANGEKYAPTYELTIC